jgi:tetratricopeptide (TPR) repeat protein
MLEDCLGNPVSRAGPAGLQGINDFVSGFLAYERRAANILAAAEADPDCVLATIYAGLLWMFLEAPTARGAATVFYDRAAAGLATANPREQMLHALLGRFMANDIPAALRLGDDIIARYPRDLATVKLHQYMNFNRGNAAEMLRIARAVESENVENPYLHGMLAFAYEQTHDLATAETEARLALKLRAKEPWAQHALAHVMLGQGRVREGVDFLNEAKATWVDLNSFMYTHNWWHKALFHISMGDNETVFDAYDHHVWGIEPDYSQDQVGAVSLLARMEIAGMDVGNRWADVADHMKTRAHDTVQPFLSLQYLYGLDKAGRAEADDLFRAIEDKAHSASDFDRLVWLDVALPAARGVRAHARGQFPEAARWLALTNPRLTEIGGSHAQRDLFGQLLLDAHLKSGHWSEARLLLEKRKLWDPDSVPLNRALTMVNARLWTAD